MKFKDILNAFEGNGKIFDFKFKRSRFPMYYTLRLNMFMKVESDNFGVAANPHAKGSFNSVLDVMKYLYHSIVSNLFFAKKKDVYIFCSDRGGSGTKKNGFYIDTCYGGYQDIFPENVGYIEKSVRYSFYFPKKQKSYYSDLVDLIAFVVSRFSFCNREDVKNIENFIIYVRNNFDFDEDYIMFLKKTLYRTAKKEWILYFLYWAFFKLKKPKLIILEYCNTGTSYILINVAKKLGIKVAEQQHGVIFKDDCVYNHTKYLYPYLKDYFSDYLLTFGKLWSDNASIPIKKIEVGKQALIDSLSNIRFNKSHNNRNILFITAGLIDGDGVCSFLLKILPALKTMGYKIFLRPHRGELPLVNQRYKKIMGTDIIFDSAPLFETLKISDIVVGFYPSTVLYEAICFTQKIYLHNIDISKYYNIDDFIKFDTDLDLLQSIKLGKSINLEQDTIWLPDWKNAHIKFIKNNIGLNIIK